MDSFQFGFVVGYILGLWALFQGSRWIFADWLKLTGSRPAAWVWAIAIWILPILLVPAYLVARSMVAASKNGDVK